MAFYESIADVYDLIFPPNKAQLNFILKDIDNCGTDRVLDIGCGTGSLSISMMEIFSEVTGIDPDSKMLEIAIEKAGKNLPNLRFRPLGMLDIKGHFRDFNAVICFGNTLVHLETEEEVFSFLEQAHQILVPGGVLMIQIINYDRVIDKGINALPTIENEHVSFVRNYQYKASANKLAFETILNIKGTGQTIRNEIDLLPVRKATLDNMLIRAGFCNIRFYGSFNRDPLTADSIPLVLEAHRPH